MEVSQDAVRCFQVGRGIHSGSSARRGSQPIAVTDLGDSFRFEKKTPFGASTWTRKKSELTDEEKALPWPAGARRERNHRSQQTSGAQ